MKNLISGFLLLLLAVTAWQYFSFHKKSKTLTVVKKESGLQKITVLDIINPSLTANENAFIDEQALHRLINDKSDQSVTPTSCGNWWNFTENNKSSCIQLSYHPNRVGNTPVSYTHLRAHETVLDLVCRLLLEKKKKNYSINPYSQQL